MSRKKQAIYIYFILAGSFLLSLFSIIQKIILNINPFALNGFIIPIIFGSAVGAILAFFMIRIKREKLISKGVLSSISCPTIVTNRQGQIVDYNNAATKILNLTKNEILGKRINEILEFNPAEEVEGNSKISSKIFQMELNNKPFYFGRYVQKFKDPFTKDIYFVTSLSDLTERIESEKRLIEAKNLAEKADRLKSEFLAQISHEIRTPINTITSFSSIIESELKEKSEFEFEEYSEFFSSIRKGSKRLIRTVDSILNFAQMQLGNYEVFIEEINLYDLVNSISENYLPEINAKNLSFTLNANKKDIYAKIDKELFQLLFENLLENSIKYTSEGYITVNLNEENNQINFSIEDTGSGIDKEFHDKIFEPFAQEDSGYSRKFEGMGLGLSLVKRCMELNKGEMELTSEKNKGTKFHLTFKAA